MRMLADLISQSGERQAVWAQRLGIDEGHLSRLLAGKKRPSLVLAARIERLTGGAVPAASWVEPDEAAPASEETSS